MESQSDEAPRPAKRKALSGGEAGKKRNAPAPLPPVLARGGPFAEGDTVRVEWLEDDGVTTVWHRGVVVKSVPGEVTVYYPSDGITTLHKLDEDRVVKVAGKRVVKVGGPRLRQGSPQAPKI